ncbi:uncharacterized protein LOC133464681 isoform X2 [Cololabis saira]|uniref:uncharacterized protein LOC133464681 isoform X2 n=1 Tax=Cololabis saira TaxID=129043 RepID=UPI002AD26CC4|nr:uncharacterized protein LOC133464681 isoform X2 [Cololabis saira]
MSEIQSLKLLLLLTWIHGTFTEKDKTAATNKPTVKTSTTTSTSIINPTKKDRITVTTILVIVAAVVIASLIITAVVVVRWRKTKEGKQQMGPKSGSSVNPAAARSGPESSGHTMDPEDEVSYITINHCNVNRGAQVQDRYPQHDGVIYSTVQDRAAAGAAPDLNNGIYSVVQKTNR